MENCMRNNLSFTQCCSKSGVRLGRFCTQTIVLEHKMSGMVSKDASGFELGDRWLEELSENFVWKCPKKIDSLKALINTNAHNKTRAERGDVKVTGKCCKQKDAEKVNVEKQNFQVRSKRSLHEESILYKRVCKEAKTSKEFCWRNSDDNNFSKQLLSGSSQHGHIAYRERIVGFRRKFQALVRILQQEQESSKEKNCPKLANKSKHKRADLMALELLKEKGTWMPHVKQWTGVVPGVETGDVFYCRLELRLVGLHRHIIRGIDSIKHNGVQIATCIVSSAGGYSDTMENPNVLIYEGEGGHPSFRLRNKNPCQDSKLVGGNLALKNNIAAQIPVRVIHGFKDRRGKAVYVYDGLYLVEDIWSEIGQNESSVFKFRLQRMSGQPQLVPEEILFSKCPDRSFKDKVLRAKLKNKN